MAYKGSDQFSVAYKGFSIYIYIYTPFIILESVLMEKTRSKSWELSLKNTDLGYVQHSPFLTYALVFLVHIF